MVSSFDEDKGPNVDYIYPDNTLPKNLENEVKMLALPRTSSRVTKDCFYVVRIRKESKKLSASYSTVNDEYLYGYVYFQLVL
jgi:hypothetical protein